MSKMIPRATVMSVIALQNQRPGGRATKRCLKLLLNNHPRVRVNNMDTPESLNERLRDYNTKKYGKKALKKD